MTAIGGAPVLYTLQGNIYSIGSTASMTYNSANQLKTSTAGGNSGTYSYDAFGQRLKVQPPTAPLQVYQYDQQGNLLMETDNSIETDYVFLDGTPIATITPSTSTISYLHTDRQGTPQLATNASKATVWSATYDPFGNTLPSGSITQNLRLPGQYADNTGFNHNGFRNYNPTMGRYLESDPVGLGGGLNTYAYASSSPVTLVDPEGLREHSYTVTDPICSLSDSCTPQSVFQELQDNPAPFIDHHVNSGDSNYIPGLGHIVTCVNESNLSLTNSTLPDHLLYPGQVTRSIVTIDGVVVVQTVGTGTGGLALLNELLAPLVWGSTDSFGIGRLSWNPFISEAY